MNCREVRSYLDLFHDDEIEVEKNLEVLKHLNICPACADIFEGEGQVRRDLKRRYEVATAPDSLRRRIRATSRPRWAFSLGIGAGVAAAAVIAVMVLWPASRVTPEALAQMAVQYHAAPPRGEIRPAVSGDAAMRGALADHFRSQGVESCLHDLSEAGYQYTSGAVLGDFRFRGVACWTLQESTDRLRLTHINIPADHVDIDPSQQMPIRVTRDGKVVVIMRSRTFV